MRRTRVFPHSVRTSHSSNFINSLESKIIVVWFSTVRTSAAAKETGSVVQAVPGQIAKRLETLKVLVVDDEPAMRKVTRSLLQLIGVKTIHEAKDGRGGLDAICRLAPDIVIFDWQMPDLNGLEFMRAVRAPGRFPLPDVPVIMLTGHGERARITEAIAHRVHEFLLKPVSSKALLARLVSIIVYPRRMIQNGDYYVPEPRKLSSYKPESDPAWSEIALV